MHNYYNDQHESKQDKKIKTEAEQRRKNEAARKIEAEKDQVRHDKLVQEETERSEAYRLAQEKEVLYKETQATDQTKRSADEKIFEDAQDASSKAFKDRFDLHEKDHTSGTKGEKGDKGDKGDTGDGSSVGLDALTARVVTLEANTGTNDHSVLEAKLTAAEAKIGVLEANDNAEVKQATFDALAARVLIVETQPSNADVIAIQEHIRQLQVNDANEVKGDMFNALTGRVSVLETNQVSLGALEARISAIEQSPDGEGLKAYILVADEKFAALSKRVDELIVAPGIVR